MEVMTIVEGKIPSPRRKSFEMLYANLKNNPLPSGLIQSRLLREKDDSGIYRIETIWKNKRIVKKIKNKERTEIIDLFVKIGVIPLIDFYEIADNLEVKGVLNLTN